MRKIMMIEPRPLMNEILTAAFYEMLQNDLPIETVISVVVALSGEPHEFDVENLREEHPPGYVYPTVLQVRTTGPSTDR